MHSGSGQGFLKYRHSHISHGHSEEYTQPLSRAYSLHMHTYRLEQWHKEFELQQTPFHVHMHPLGKVIDNSSRDTEPVFELQQSQRLTFTECLLFANRRAKHFMWTYSFFTMRL